MSNLACMISNCYTELGWCLLDTNCRDTFMCDSKCDATDLACFFTCESTYGLTQKTYTAVSNCIAKYECMDPIADDGKCLPGDLDGDSTVQTIEDMRGSWWVVQGVNKDFDNAPCQ